MRTPSLVLAGLSLAVCPIGLAAAAQPETLTPAKAPPATTAPAAAAPADGGESPLAPPTINPLIGKAPPPITVAKWVKGEPLTGFEKGKVYIVDFWATWCGPCKAAIPHLTRLAHDQKGKVEVIGISISEHVKNAEDLSYIEAVEKFVEKMDDRMDYRVAVDTPDKKMHETWFKPSGMGGIPTAFIIDQKGLVAWIGIGSPKDVERITTEVLAGTFDIKKEAEHERQEALEAKKRSDEDIAAAKEAAAKEPGGGMFAKYPGYKEAMDRGDQAAALESLNTAFKNDPASEATFAYQWKFMILMQRGKAEEVNQYSRELLQKYPDNDDIMGFASACIVATDYEPKFDKDLALTMAQKAATLAKPDSRWQQFTKWRLGWAYFHTGDKAKATEAMQAALEGVKKLKGKFDFGDLESECEDALHQFAKPAK